MNTIRLFKLIVVSHRELLRVFLSILLCLFVGIFAANMIFVTCFNDIKNY